MNSSCLLKTTASSVVAFACTNAMKRVSISIQPWDLKDGFSS